jgi:hypothetical protein
MCFDDDAEVVPANKPLAMRFDEAEFVHPERPLESVDAVQNDHEDDIQADHEASSLAGSVRALLCQQHCFVSRSCISSHSFSCTSM